MAKVAHFAAVGAIGANTARARSPRQLLNPCRLDSGRLLDRKHEPTPKAMLGESKTAGGPANFKFTYVERNAAKKGEAYGLTFCEPIVSNDDLPDLAVVAVIAAPAGADRFVGPVDVRNRLGTVPFIPFVCRAAAMCRLLHQLTPTIRIIADAGCSGGHRRKKWKKRSRRYSSVVYLRRKILRPFPPRAANR